MSGLKFENQIYQSAQEKPTKLVQDNSLLTKTTPKFVDKNQEYAVPIEKGLHYKYYYIKIKF